MDERWQSKSQIGKMHRLEREEEGGNVEQQFKPHHFRPQISSSCDHTKLR